MKLFLWAITLYLCNFFALYAHPLVIRNKSNWPVTVTVYKTCNEAKDTLSSFTLSCPERPLLGLPTQCTLDISLGSLEIRSASNKFLSSLPSNKLILNLSDLQPLIEENPHDTSVLVISADSSELVVSLEIEDQSDSGITVPNAVDAQNRSTYNGVESITYGVYQSRGRRNYQEDTYAIDSKKGLFGVFDGHGGSEVAEFAAQHIHRVLEQTQQETADIPTVLERTLKKIDTDLESSYLKEKVQKTGTTALVALLQVPNLFIANVGDSRAVLCSDGKAQALSSDQKPERQDEAERILHAGGKVVQVVFRKSTGNYYLRETPPWDPSAPLRVTLQEIGGGLTMTRSLGDHLLRVAGIIATPEIYQHVIKANDAFLILCSDGIFEKDMSNQDAVEIVRSKLIKHAATPDKAPKKAAKALVNQAFKRGSLDNVTAVVIVFGKNSR